MWNTNKSSRIRSTVATVAIGVVLSLVVLNAERRNTAVFVGDAVSAPVTTSAPAAPGDFDYFPSHFASPQGAIEDLPPQF